MDFSEVIKNRYSCKKFSDVEVKKEKLDKRPDVSLQQQKIFRNSIFM